MTPDRKLLWPSSTTYPFTNVPPSVAESVQRAFPQIHVVVPRTEQAIRDEFPDAEILISWKISPEQFAVAKKLKWIHCPAAGVNELMIPQLVASSVIITNGSTVHAVPVAEQTMALILAISRRLPASFRCQMEERWGRMDSWQPGLVPNELGGKALGVIGFGTIGRELAFRARSFGMRILAVKRDPSRGIELADRCYTPDQLGQMLREADFVVIAVPETAGTRHLIGADELAQMKPSAHLINVARGSLVNSDALLAALNQKIIAGAALDVTDPEPLPAGHPFWKFANVIITPHLGGATDRYWERQVNLLCENLRRYLANEPLNLVDKHRGY